MHGSTTLQPVTRSGQRIEATGYPKTCVRQKQYSYFSATGNPRNLISPPQISSVPTGDAPRSGRKTMSSLLPRWSNERDLSCIYRNRGVGPFRDECSLVVAEIFRPRHEMNFICQIDGRMFDGNDS
jgi:hypothetical protein